jgi:hypothetical protein
MQLTIRTSDDLMLQINQIAEEMGLKKSDVTRMALKRFADDYTRRPKAEKPYNRLKHLLGMAESGLTDLGQRHREHLIKQIKKDYP